MGTRHVLRLIARVRPYGAPPNHLGRYRCIASLHQSYDGYGLTIIQSICRLITLLRVPENASIIRAELHALDGKYGAYGTQPPCIPNIPCPYTGALLLSGWYVHMIAAQKMSVAGSWLVRDLGFATEDCWGGYRVGGAYSNGITIVDVTDPAMPAYCILKPSILDAREYLLPYDTLRQPLAEEDRIYDLSDRQICLYDRLDEEGWMYDSGDENVFWDDDVYCPSALRIWNCLKRLVDVPLVTAEAVADAWPEEYHSTVAQSADFESKTTSVISYTPVVPALSDMILGVAVKQCAHIDDPDAVEQLLRLPGKAPEIKAILKDLKPFPDTGISLLIRTLSELKVLSTSHVDLTGFQLSGSQIAEVLSTVDGVEVLDASYNSVLVADGIPIILESAPSLRRLVVMNCASIVDQQIIDLVQAQPARFKTLEGLLHPAFLGVKNEKPTNYPFAFTFAALKTSRSRCCTSISFFTPAQVVQALTDLIPWQWPNTPDNKDHLAPLAGLSAFHSGVRQPGVHFGRRPVVSVPQVLENIPLGQKELWVFMLHAPRKREYGEEQKLKFMWGFVHLTKAEDSSIGDDGVLVQTEIKNITEEAVAKHPPQQMEKGISREEKIATTDHASEEKAKIFNEKLGYWGQVYDLRGFLECMAREERPMPTEKAVKKLEKLLYTIDKRTGGIYCPLMCLTDIAELEPVPVVKRQNS